MACTFISVGSLIVLILASIFANLKSTQGISTTIQNDALSTIAQFSSSQDATTEPNAGLIGTDVRETNQTVLNASKNNTNTILLGTLNCSSSTDKIDLRNCSTNATTLSNERQITYRDFKEYQYYKNLFLVYPYIANIPGMITNSLTILIAVNIKPSHTSELYMIALGIADFFTVASRFIYQMWSNYVDDKTSSGCKLTHYIPHISVVYSNMILMFWTIERFIAVMFPIKLATWCSIRNTKISLTVLLVVCLLLGIPYLTDMDVYSYWTGKVTVNVCFHSMFFTKVWTHSQSVYYIYIPVVLVFICNTAILCRLSAMTKARIQMASNQETIDKKASENKRMTILLLAISGFFLILHLPYTAVLIFYYFYPDPTIYIADDPHFFVQYIFYSNVGLLITEFQNTVNFFLYCLSGSKFRTTFMKLFCKSFIQDKEGQVSRSLATRSTNF